MGENAGPIQKNRNGKKRDYRENRTQSYKGNKKKRKTITNKISSPTTPEKTIGKKRGKVRAKSRLWIKNMEGLRIEVRYEGLWIKMPNMKSRRGEGARRLCGG